MAFFPERYRYAFSWWSVVLVLMALAVTLTVLFPAGSERPISMTRAQAKNDATQIAMALDQYLSEYGRLPISAKDDVTVSEETQSYLMDVLCPTDPAKGSPENPRALLFLEIPKAKKGHNGRIDGKERYLDSWGNPYIITLDSNDDGAVRNPCGNTPAPKLQKTAIVWSRGNPEKPAFNDPAKWIKSWE